MYLLFLIVSCIGAIYFVAAKRRFDYFSLAFFSAILYFSPGFFGYASYHINGYWYHQELVDETYAVMIFVVSSLVFSGIVFSQRQSIPRLERQVEPRYSFVLAWLIVLSFIGLFGVLLTSGGVIASHNKSEVLEGLNRWHIIFTSAATIGLPLAFAARKKLSFFLFFLFLVFDLYIGNRSGIVISLMSVFVIALSQNQKPVRLLEHWLIAALVVFFGLFMLIIKQLLAAIKFGDVSIVQAIASESGFLINSIVQSEPFVTQTVLNSVIVNNFKTELDHVFSVFYQFIVFSENIGLHSLSFNDYFQPTLFPAVEYGMASNIWAQMWSAGGWLLLGLFMLFFIASIYFANKTLDSSRIIIRAGLSPVFVYWVFYIHRNDLSYQVNIDKRLLIVFFVCLVMSMLTYNMLKPYIRNKRENKGLGTL